MSIRTTADRFKELGLKPPDISIFNRPEKITDKFGREPSYNTRVLVDNWYEDRRQYKLLCPRCTGPTIYKTDYQPSCPEQQAKQFPPIVHQRRLEGEGEGWNLIRNTEDYCLYLSNYTTTTDLVHNWEVRRAGVKPKPWRKWKMIQDSSWVPNNDNTVSFGNLTQLGYRKAGQVPLMPNDWDLYANTGYLTETRDSYPKRKWPEDYVLCRRAPSKATVKEVREQTLTHKPRDPRDHCGEASLYYAGKDPPDEICQPHCPGEDGRRPAHLRNETRFGNAYAQGMTVQLPAKQTLHLPRQIWPYKALKHPPHQPAEPCKITHWSGGVVPDHCRENAGETRFDFKGVFRDETTL